ncbi:hypothetical protein BD414DRAFT_479891 [Trametes punicea]|nr:hypothetical protein BD414DRAFT_479891 [Trametes punicea]
MSWEREASVQYCQASFRPGACPGPFGSSSCYSDGCLRCTSQGQYRPRRIDEPCCHNPLNHRAWLALRYALLKPFEGTRSQGGKGGGRGVGPSFYRMPKLAAA